jgi:hypothetical protein
VKKFGVSSSKLDATENTAQNMVVTVSAAEKAAFSGTAPVPQSGAASAGTAQVEVQAAADSSGGYDFTFTVGSSPKNALTALDYGIGTSTTAPASKSATLSDGTETNTSAAGGDYIWLRVAPTDTTEGSAWVKYGTPLLVSNVSSGYSGLAAYVASMASAFGKDGSAADKAIPVKLTGTMPSGASTGAQITSLYNALAALNGSAGYYIDLDLSGVTGLHDTTWTSGSSAPPNAVLNKLHSIAVPDSVTTLANGSASNVFENFAALASISGAGVTTIDGYVPFSGTKITEFTDAQFPSLTTFGQAAPLGGCTTLATISLDGLTTVPAGFVQNLTSLTSLTLPAATSIGASAFSGCTSLKTVTLPSSTTYTIGQYAFENCSALTTVNNLDECTSIGDDAFRGCSSLSSSLSLTNAGLTSIPDNAFNGCAAIDSVTLGSNVATINDAFLNTKYADSGNGPCKIKLGGAITTWNAYDSAALWAYYQGTTGHTAKEAGWYYKASGSSTWQFSSTEPTL